MAMKSVPPLVASTERQMLTATPLRMPPKTEMSRGSGDEQGIVGNDIRGQHIGQNAADHDQQQGQQRELLPDIAEADIHRKGVERQVNRRVVGDEAQKLFAQALDQHRQARDAAGEQVRGTDKGLDRDCQQQGCEKDGEDAA